MYFKYKRSVFIITYVFSALTSYNVNCYKIKIEKSSLIKQYKENTTLTKERRLNATKNDNLLDIPENNMKKLLNNTPPFYLNGAFTKANCRTTRCFRNIKVYHKTINSPKKLNRIFFKLHRFNGRKSDNVIKEHPLRNNRYFQLESNKLLDKRSIAENETQREDIETTNKEEVKDRKIRFGNISIVAATRSSILEFPEAPPQHVIKVLEFNPENEYFGVFSDLMGYLQPTSFPLDFLRDVVHNHMSIHLLIFKAIKIEGRVLAWLFMWLILSLALPCAVIAQSCCTNKGMERLHDNYSINSDRQGNIKSKIIAIAMHTLLVLLLVNIALILATNEQISRTTSTAPKTITTMLEDVEAFVDNTQMQISTVTTSSVQIAVEAIRMDLEGAEDLLGKPLQQALDDQTGLEAAIQALTDLSTVTADLSLRVSALIKHCNEARNTGKSLQESLIELSKLLTATRQGCFSRDQPLCDTLQTEPFNVLLHVDQISSDRKIKKIMEISYSENFNRTIEIAQKTYKELPKRISLETSASRTEIRSALNRHRNELYESIETFEDTTNSLKEKLRGYNDTVYNVVANISAKDLWRWTLVLGLSVLTFLVWGFLICGAPCGCDPTPKTALFLRTGLGLTCTLSLIMWIFGALSFLIGTHCHVLVCQPLYEDPRYLTLNDLLNSKDIVSKRDGDFFTYLFKDNNTIRIDNILNNCKSNRTAFYTFALDGIMDVDSLTDAYKWRDLQKSFKKFPTILNNFEILTPELLYNLQEITVLSTVNLTAYRINISHPITNKDLNALADQLNSVSKQLINTRTASEMEMLAVKAQNISNTEYKQLKHIRDEILYQMAALEVSLLPLNKQVVQSLSHLRTTQYFINNEGVEIAKKVSSDYIYNINRKMQEMYEYVKKKVNFEIGSCRPLWEVYDSTRSMICKKIVDPMNGFSFACFLCILLFLGLAPVVIQTVNEYKDSEDSLDSSTHRRARNGMLINDECTWATPSIRSSSEEYPRPELPPYEAHWPTRQPVEPLIPPAPRILDATRLMRAAVRDPEPAPPTIELPTRTPETQSFAKVARILDTARNVQPPVRSPETNLSAGVSDIQLLSKAARIFHPPKAVQTARSPQPEPTSSNMPSGVQRLSNVARIFHPTKAGPASISRPEPTRNIKSPLPKIIQAMTSKARNKYESLKLIERLDRISPRSWL